MKATLLAALLLALFPTRLGEPLPATSDAAHYIGHISDLDPRLYTKKRASRAGYPSIEWRCLDRLAYRESRWRNVGNASSSAQGYFQILNMPADTPLHKQVDRFFDYITERYEGSFCSALKHSLAKGWY